MGSSASAQRKALSRKQHARRLLILGCMGSGKTTLCRHLVRVARGTPPVLKYYRHTIENNLVEIWKTIYALSLDYNLDTSPYMSEFELVEATRHREELSGKVSNALRRLAKSGLVEDAEKKGLAFRLPYNYRYFVFFTDRILAKGFEPTETDVLHSYAQTVGVNSQNIRFDYLYFDLVELPGHHIFRRNWNDYFSDTSCVIFLVDLSELCMEEFYSGHLKEKTFAVWTDVLSHPILAKTPFLLLFNKQDIIENAEGFDYSRLSNSTRTWEDAVSYYRKTLVSQAPSQSVVYSHSVSLTKKVNLSKAVIDSLTDIFKTNKDSFEAE